MKEIVFTSAGKSDERAIKSLLMKESLPAQDLSVGRQSFIVAKTGSRLIGCVGLEIHGQDGLLRSLAVENDFRGRGLALSLYERLSSTARQKGVRRLHLLTTTARTLFKKWGFQEIQRLKAPPSIQRTAEFKTLCPSTAVYMTRDLQDAAAYFPKDLLALRPDVPGSVMWGVSLDKAMLTYFEVRPRSRFKRHHHASEQITMVLKGELFFQMKEWTVRLGAGEVIAIPSNVPHAVYTKDKPAKAIDAWSPVMKLYTKGE